MFQKRTESFLFSTLKNHFINYPTPFNLSYLWNFGSLAGFCLMLQITTGFFLSVHYTADVATSFNSVEHIMRDVNLGWLFRYTHANGASMFLLVVYIHMARGIYYRSYLKPRGGLWVSGVVLFLLLMGSSFLGYVLPWGQMSFWGATVITNLASAIPFVGKYIAYWLWGGFSVDNATLTRFFSLHFLLPFVMVAITLTHLTLLHADGSTNPLGISECADYIPFYPYFWLKDIFGFLIFLILFSFLVFFEPNLLGHPDNYIRANALVTPAHIVPEWYFLPFYAILRAVPDKLGGVILMGASIAILFFLPLIDRNEYTYLPYYVSLFKIPDFLISFFLDIITFTCAFCIFGYELVGACRGACMAYVEKFVMGVVDPEETVLLYASELAYYRPNILPLRGSVNRRPITPLQSYMLLCGANLGFWLQFISLLRYLLVDSFLHVMFMFNLWGEPGRSLRLILRTNGAPLGAYKGWKAAYFFAADLFLFVHGTGVPCYTFRTYLAECGSTWDVSPLLAYQQVFYSYILFIGFPFFACHALTDFETELSRIRRATSSGLLDLPPTEPYIDVQLLVILEALQVESVKKKKAKKKKEPLLITSFFKAPRYRIFFRLFFFIWVASFILLGVLGAKPVEYPYSELSALATGYYFCFFLFLI